MIIIIRIIIAASLIATSSWAARNAQRAPSRILFGVQPVGGAQSGSTGVFHEQPAKPAVEVIKHEDEDEDINQDFTELKNQIIENKLTHVHLVQALHVLLSQWISDQNFDRVYKTARTKAFLKTINRLFRDVNLLTDTSREAKNFREKFLTQLQSALKKLPAEDPNEAKELLVKALAGKE